VPHSETKPLFDIGKQYVVADRMFASHIDSSFVSHQYIIAGQANSAVDIPLGTWGCGGGKQDTVQTLQQDRTYGPTESPCFNYKTLGDELDSAGVPWRYYAASTDDLYLAYEAVKHIRNGPDWAADIRSPSAQFLTDVQNGDLAAVTWITPTGSDSDHAGSGSSSGPEWVASIVNAVGESQFWDTTTVFVMWDEWGGWYDHVAPPYVDYDGLGFRVPLMIVSPYAKKGYVSHVQYEHGSILRYVEDLFGLGRLAATDARALSPAADCFDYSRPPRTFKPFATTLRPRDFTFAPPDFQPADAY